MRETTTRKFTGAAYLHGALCGLAAVSSWAGNIVVGSLGLWSELTAWDITGIRFTVAGALLGPLLARSGLALDRLGWLGSPRLSSAERPPSCWRMRVCCSRPRRMPERSFPA
jgi:hypothetical protein